MPESLSQWLTPNFLPRQDVISLVIAYTVLAAVVLGLNLHSGWHWLVKSATTLTVVALCWVAYGSWPALLGWPTANEVPERFYLHAATVDEPEFVYLWGVDLSLGLARTVPRSFAVPYSRTLHDRVDKATRKLRKGLPVIGQTTPASVAIDELGSLERVEALSDIVFIDAPQSLVPGKN